jgi:hypothetical protein
MHKLLEDSLIFAVIPLDSLSVDRTLHGCALTVLSMGVR